MSINEVDSVNVWCRVEARVRRPESRCHKTLHTRPAQPGHPDINRNEYCCNHMAVTHISTLVKILKLSLCLTVYFKLINSTNLLCLHVCCHMFESRMLQTKWDIGRLICNEQSVPVSVTKHFWSRLQSNSCLWHDVCLSVRLTSILWLTFVLKFWNPSLLSLAVFGQIAKQCRPMEWCCLSVCVRLSDINIFVNLCVKVLEVALQSRLTVFGGLKLF